MAKKLIKRNAGKSPAPATKVIQVEDDKGNKHILKATVFSVNPTVHTVRKDESSAEITDTRLEEVGLTEKIIRPPLSQADLAALWEVSSELGQTIDIMAIGIEGFGGRLVPRKKPKEMSAQDTAKADDEKLWLESFLESPNPKGSFTTFRKESREDLEATGNSYWELVPSVGANKGRYACINKLDVSSLFITKADRMLTKMEVPYLTPDLEIKKRVFQVKFRRFVQVVGNRKVWFKEFGDPRTISRETGEVVEGNLPKGKQANEVIHRKLYVQRRTPYGMPRFTGNIIAIKGSRNADETNILTQQNNNVPSMAVTVSGGTLTDGSIQRIQEFVDTQIKGDANYSKFLLLEADGETNGLGGTSNVKIEIKPLTDAQHKDQLWQDYDKSNAAKIRRSFRMAPILVGSSENYDRATAQVSEALTEKYVFNPEREEMDTIINRLFLHQGIRYWKYKSNSPNVTNDEDLVKILTGAEKSGGMTPRIAREILGDILNKELPGFDDAPEDFNPDVPFSYTLAKLMHEAGQANQNGTMEPQGQTPKAPGKPGRPPKPDDMMDDDTDAEKILAEMVDPQAVLDKMFKDPDAMLNTLLKIRDTLEDSMDAEALGKPRRDFFKHGH